VSKKVKAPVLILFVLACGASGATMEDLLDAIECVESGGDSNAIGDSKRAIGAYQLHTIYVDECNRILKLQKIDKCFTWNDRWDKAKSREITRIVLSYYQARFKLNLVEVGRCHNGGMYGYKKESTVKYGNKIKKLLKEKEKMLCTG